MLKRFPSPFWINVLAAVGAAVIVVGFISACSNIVRAMGGDPVLSSADASSAALSPALAMNPLLLDQIIATTSASLTPVRLIIPAIGVDARVDPVGLNAQGSMVAPSNFTDVTWYSPGAKPGNPGNTVIAGHVNNALTMAGVFEHLSDLKIGDTITVADASGRSLTYVVTQVQAYEADSAPTGSVFATTGPSQLVLITCDGQWDASAHQFDKRLIVNAQLVH
jgi:sortase A